MSATNTNYLEYVLIITAIVLVGVIWLLAQVLVTLSSSILNFLFYLVNLSLEFSSSYISLWHFSWLSFTVTISFTTYGDLCGSGGP